MKDKIKKQPYIFALIVGLIIALIILFSWLIYTDRQEQLSDYYSLWDSCDYYVFYTPVALTEKINCYNPYVYLRVKEDGRFGRFCFIGDYSTKEKGTIYGYCDWEEQK